MYSLRKSAVFLGLATASLVPSSVHASPIGNVHEGAGYAVAVGTGGKTATCASTAQFIPVHSANVTTAPIGVTVSARAQGTAACVGTLPISQGITVEAWNVANTRYLKKDCPGAALTCDLVIPPGWGEFYIMPSAFWDAPNDATWTIMNPVNNDGYCNVNSGADPSSIVCRAWATGIS